MGARASTYEFFRDTNIQSITEIREEKWGMNGVVSDFKGGNNSGSS